MVWQLCDDSMEDEFGKWFAISMFRGFCWCPCPLQAWEILMANISSKMYADMCISTCLPLGGCRALVTCSFSLWSNMWDQLHGFLHYPVGPTRSPNSVGRFPCSIGCIRSMQRWPCTNMPSAISSSCKPGCVSSWTSMDPSPSSSRYPWSLHYCWVYWRVFPLWFPIVESGTSTDSHILWR